MGYTSVGEFELVGRDVEVRAIRDALQGAAGLEGRLILISGEAGIGKSRLLEEARSLAKAGGFDVAESSGSPEAVAPFKPWLDALSRLGLAGLLEEEPPPRLHGLYVLNHSGLLVSRADREGSVAVDPDLFAAMSSAVGDFLDDSLTASVGSDTGEILRFAHGERGVCVSRGPGFALCAVFEGRENDALFEDLAGLRDRIDRRVGEEVRKWRGGEGSLPELAYILRMLLESGRYEGTPPPSEGTGRKLDIYERTLRGLRRAAASRPLLITLDSLQWFDGSSIGLLRFLARNAKGDPLLILASYRTGEGEGRVPFSEALNAIRTEGTAVDLPLSRLTKTASRELARRVLGAPAGRAEVLDEIADRSLGNPLFLLEIVRSARGAGLLDSSYQWSTKHSLDALKVPPRLRDLVGQRISKLSGPERELLDAASVLGSLFTTTTLADIVDQGDSAVSRQLTEIARKHSFLVEEKGSWRFNHPLMREALYEGLSSDLRVLYHREAALVLKEAEGSPEAIGSHFAAAGDQRAISYLMTAASQARARGSVEEAAAFLRSALAVAPKESRVMLARWQADALEEAGSYADAMEAMREARAAGAPKVECACREIRLLDGMSRWDDACRVARNALPGLGRSGSGQVLATLASVQVAMGRHEEGAKTARRALSRLAPGDSSSRGAALFSIARAHLIAGRHGQAYQFFEKSLKERESGKDSRGIAASMAGLAWVHVFRGEYDAALARLYRSTAICEALGDRLGTASVMQGIGYVYYERGEHDEALETLRGALATLEALGQRHGVAATLHSIAVVLQDRGEYSEALEYLARSLGIRQAIGDRAGIAAAYSNIGDAFAQYGFGRSALMHLEEAIEISRALGDATVLGRARSSSVVPRINSGDLVRAREDAEAAVKLARDSGARSDEALAYRALGEVLAAEERMDDASDAFDRSLRCFRALRAEVKAADTLRRWGLAAVSAGELELGRERLDQAATAFDAVGLGKRSAEVKRELARLGGVAT